MQWPTQEKKKGGKNLTAKKLRAQSMLIQIIFLKNGIAYGCYNPIYRDNSDFQRLTVPSPHPIPSKPRPITPNPEPPIRKIPPQLRRGLDQLPTLQEFTFDSDNHDDNDDDDDDNNDDNNNNGQVLYAAANDINKNNPTEERDEEGEEGKKAPGRPRMEDTCTEEYLNERGMKPKKNRYYFRVDG